MTFFIPKLDYDFEFERISEFIKDIVDKAQVKGVVVGLSGGIDSSIVASLCVKALGPNRVLGLIIPASFTPREDVNDARELAEQYKFEAKVIDIDPIVNSILHYSKGNAASKTALGNLRARIRMVLNYHYANMRNLLVAGTGNRSEYLVGYFTKFGDGAADFYPIMHLYKGEVRELGRYLKLPEQLTNKPASPQLWPEHKAIDELPADYNILDSVLYGLFSLDLDPEKLSKETGTPLNIISEVIKLHERTKHKRIQGPKLQRIEK